MRRAIEYHVERGEIFERLVMIKDRRTHRRRVPVQAQAVVLIDGVSYVLPTTITSEGAVLISMSPEQTEWLIDGTFWWDMEALVSRSAMLTSTPMTETIAMNGTLTVTTYVNLAPLSSDGVQVPLMMVVEGVPGAVHPVDGAPGTITIDGGTP